MKISNGFISHTDVSLSGQSVLHRSGLSHLLVLMIPANSILGNCNACSPFMARLCWHLAVCLLRLLMFRDIFFRQHVTLTFTG